MLITLWENGKSGWKVKNWKWKTNQLCHPKETGTKVSWMIYHEKTQIRAKAGFHVSIEMYDGMKCMMCVEWSCWHKFGYWLWYISRTLAVKLMWFEKRKMMLPVDPVLCVTAAHQGTGTGCSTAPVTRFQGEYFHFFGHFPLTHNAQRRFLLFSSVVCISAGYMLQNCLPLFCFAPRMKKAQCLGYTQSCSLIFWVTLSVLQYSC